MRERLLRDLLRAVVLRHLLERPVGLRRKVHKEDVEDQRSQKSQIHSSWRSEVSHALNEASRISPKSSFGQWNVD